MSSVWIWRLTAERFRSSIGVQANPDPYVPKSMAATTFAFFNLAHPSQYSVYGFLGASLKETFGFACRGFIPSGL